VAGDPGSDGDQGLVFAGAALLHSPLVERSTRGRSV
jgi:hypothetical protein